MHLKPPLSLNVVYELCLLSLKCIISCEDVYCPMKLFACDSLPLQFQLIMVISTTVPVVIKKMLFALADFRYETRGIHFRRL